jgi:V/A-type H+-transporting ATPase subunit E
MLMEAQLQELLDKIRDEGVKEAEHKAALIIKEAEEKAAALIADARKQADKAVVQAEEKAAQAVVRSEAALQQAGRDLLLKMREMISRLFDELLKKELRNAFQGDLVGELAAKAVAAFSPRTDNDVELKVPEADAKRLEKHLRAVLAKEVSQGLVITPVDTIDAGFQIGEKDGAVYHDITDTGLAEILGAFVNPRLAELIRRAAAGAEQTK